MGPGQNFLTRVGSSWVSHLLFGFEFGKFPLTTSNFSILSLQIKKISSESNWVEGGSASYLLRVNSKFGSGQGPSLYGTITKRKQICTQHTLNDRLHWKLLKKGHFCRFFNEKLKFYFFFLRTSTVSMQNLVFLFRVQTPLWMSVCTAVTYIFSLSFDARNNECIG